MENKSEFGMCRKWGNLRVDTDVEGVLCRWMESVWLVKR